MSELEPRLKLTPDQRKFVIELSVALEEKISTLLHNNGLLDERKRPVAPLTDEGKEVLLKGLVSSVALLVNQSRLPYLSQVDLTGFAARIIDASGQGKLTEHEKDYVIESDKNNAIIGSIRARYDGRELDLPGYERQAVAIEISRINQVGIDSSLLSETRPPSRN